MQAEIGFLGEEYLLQTVFGIIGQDEDDLAIGILGQNPLFLPPLTKDGEHDAFR